MEKAITANKMELLDKLEHNLAAHEAKVTKAQENYRTKVIEELERRLADGKAGRPVDLALLARMPVPRSYANEYRQAIEELRWHTEETIELTSRDFQRFVMDEWEWAQHFAGTTQVYLSE